jgi:REP element-mobilizing transposase RayT
LVLACLNEAVSCDCSVRTLDAMASARRIEFPGAIHHVTSRGAARAPIYHDPFDRELFLELLAESVERHDWRCHAYCLMTNHYHLLLETTSPTLATGMQRLNSRYAKAFNRRHERSGHLFESRYRTIIVERESHLLEVARYVVLNPVRAGACAEPGAWPWSSYRATAGAEEVPSFLTVDWLLGQLAPTRRRAKTRYRVFIADATPSCPWRDVRHGRFLGRHPSYALSSSSAASGSRNGGIT